MSVESTNPQVLAKLKLPEVKARLAETDGEIAGTVTHLQRLEMRRKSLGDMNIPTSPILDLPLELTCEVFLRCLPHLHTRRDAPFVLAHRRVPLRLARPQRHIPPPVPHRDPCGPSRRHDHVTRPHAAALRTSLGLTIVRYLQDFSALLCGDDAWALSRGASLTLLLPSNGWHPTSIPPNLLADLTNAPLLRAAPFIGGFTPPSLRLPVVGAAHARAVQEPPPVQGAANVCGVYSEEAVLSIWPEHSFRLPNDTPIARRVQLEAFTLVGEVPYRRGAFLLSLRTKPGRNISHGMQIPVIVRLKSPRNEILKFKITAALSADLFCISRPPSLSTPRH
ncbi:hypothetical protein K438DRAFT_2000383 [Mycena galopus ATCC 62051]|nr:hypothetical protein K438DRAFT_2000383 [Mycena galopus ATCC 62051]